MAVQPQLKTRLTELLGLTTPIVLAPMSTGAGGALAAEVHKAGGFGLIPAGDASVDELKREIKLFTDGMGYTGCGPIPTGIGFLTWFIENDHIDLLDTTLNMNIKAVLFAFSDNMDRWIKYVRDFDKSKGRYTVIMIVCNKAEQAKIAANNGADIIIAQSIEAGGHGANYSSPLLVQISVMQQAVGDKGPIIVAAGGITTGSHMASVLASGAGGVCMGSRFTLASESYFSPSQRKAVVNANSTDATTRTLIFDHMVGSLGWPAGVDGRALRNKTTMADEAGTSYDEIRKSYKKAEETGDADWVATWTGLGSPLLTKESQPGKEIMKEVHDECVAKLTGVLSILGGSSVTTGFSRALV